MLRVETMLESIIEIISFGGSVTYPTKWKLSDWFQEVRVGRLSPGVKKDGRDWYVTTPYGGFLYFGTAKEAAQAFITTVFTKKNLALCYRGIQLHGMNEGVAFENMEPSKIRFLVDQYRKQYWSMDFPFAS